MPILEEKLIVVRDTENRIIAVIAKQGAVVEIYKTEITAYDEVVDLLKEIANNK